MSIPILTIDPEFQSSDGGSNLSSSAPSAKLDKARQMLAESRTLSEVKKVKDIAEAAKLYAKAARLGRETQNYAAEIALLAARKAGEILTHLQKTPKESAASAAGDSEYRKTLKETNTPERTAQVWQNLAEPTDLEFQKALRNIVGMGKELTTTGVLKEIAPPKQQAEANCLTELQRCLSPLMPIGSDGQPKLSELLDEAIALANCPGNKKDIAHIIVMLNTVATHFAGYARKLESQAALPPVPKSAPTASASPTISNRELRRRAWKADNPEYAGAKNSVVDKAIQAEIRKLDRISPKAARVA